MPQYGMQGAALAKDEDEDDDEGEDAKSTRSAYSSYSHASNASLGRLYLGSGTQKSKGRRKYIKTKDGAKISTTSTAATTAAHSAAQTPNTQAQSKNSKKKEKKKKAKDIVVIVPIKKGNTTILEEIPIDKEHVAENKKIAFREMTAKSAMIWDKIVAADKPLFGGFYNQQDDVITKLSSFLSTNLKDPAKSIANSSTMHKRYNDAAMTLAAWHVHLKTATPDKYDNETIPQAYLVINKIRAESFNAKFITSNCSALEFKTSLWCKLLEIFARGIEGAAMQAVPKLTEAQVDELKKRKITPHENLLETNTVYNNANEILETLQPLLTLFEQNKAKEQQKTAASKADTSMLDRAKKNIYHQKGAPPAHDDDEEEEN